MKNWVFTNEQLEDGVPVILSKSIDDGSIMHWEPVATKLRGYDAALFRQEITARHKSTNHCTGSAILPLQKPLSYQERIWLGWEERKGTSPFGPNYTRPATEQLIKDLLPLIAAYQEFHLHKLVVGKPDWRRIRHNDSGFYMPDPFARLFLATPQIELPAGLSSCRPPESYYGAQPTLESDIFYLGLSLYVIISGKLPYELENSWPTRALLKGDIIPLTYHCQEISPELSNLITQMLVAKKHERPSIDHVKNVWEESINCNDCLASPTQKVVNLRKYRRRNQKIWLKKSLFNPFSYLLLLALIGFGFGTLLMRNWVQNPVTPKQIAARFYETCSNPLQIESFAQNGIARDIYEARVHRTRLIAELLSRPIIEVQKLSVLSETDHFALIEAKVTWWRWVDGSWQPNQSTEIISLERRNNRWQITKRLQQDVNKM